MASSSKRSTHLEHHLRNLYRLNPSHPSHCAMPSTFAVDRESWMELRKSDMTMGRKEKIFHASVALLDTGARLFAAGRQKEAANFCEWGDWLQQLATECRS
jgi:hypothetical protein